MFTYRKCKILTLYCVDFYVFLLVFRLFCYRVVTKMLPPFINPCTVLKNKHQVLVFDINDVVGWLSCCQ